MRKPGNCASHGTDYVRIKRSDHGIYRRCRVCRNANARARLRLWPQVRTVPALVDARGQCHFEKRLICAAVRVRSSARASSALPRRLPELACQRTAAVHDTAEAIARIGAQPSEPWGLSPGVVPGRVSPMRREMVSCECAEGPPRVQRGGLTAAGGRAYDRSDGLGALPGDIRHTGWAA